MTITAVITVPSDKVELLRKSLEYQRGRALPMKEFLDNRVQHIQGTLGPDAVIESFEVSDE